MVIHPYAFMWRLRRFVALLIMILRHMRKARELDDEIAQSCSEIEKLERELEPLESKLSSIERELKKGKISKGTRVKNLGKDVEQKSREIERKKRDIGERIKSFCKEVRAELKVFKKSDIDSYTLLYKDSRYFREVAEILIASQIDKKSKKELKRKIMAEMRSIEGKAAALELQAKHLERGVTSTVVFSQISPWGSKWIEGRIRRKVIEINLLHKRLKSDNVENLFRDFGREILDIYQIGRNTTMLMKRLKATFNSVRTKLKNKGISSHELDKTQHVFKATFNKMGKISKRLDNEMGDQVRRLNKELGIFEKKGMIKPYPQQVIRKAA